MYFFIFGEATGFSVQPLDMCSEIEVFTLDFPSVFLADEVQIFIWEQTCVGTPIIGVANFDGQIRHFVQQFAKPHLAADRFAKRL